MKLKAILTTSAACVALAACGSGSSSDTGAGGSPSGGGTGGIGGSGGTAGASGGGAGSGGVSGASGSAGIDGGGAAGSGGAAGDAGAGCPVDVFGNYSVTYASGCGDVLTAATQQIVDAGACTGHFVSSMAGTLGAINGDVSFDQNGDFTGATLVIGSTSHTGCNGTWDASSQTMTVTCSEGDASSSQCVISVTRSS